MLDQVTRCLQEYQEKYRRPGLPPLAASGLYALFPEEGLPHFVEFRWNDEYPNADRSGVYLIFGRAGRLLYIGKASLGATIGGRLGTNFAGTAGCRLLSNDWTERPTYVATIATPDNMGFEASALEDFLIGRLRPSDNRVSVVWQAAGNAVDDESSGTASEGTRAATADSNSPLAPGVYTYSAPGMPLCSMCEQRPAIFHCTMHQSAVCLECVARHDTAGVCVYLPEFRAPDLSASRANRPDSPPPASGSKPASILGIG